MSRQAASVRLEAADFERLKLVAIVDRRSISEVVAECVTRALPGLEAELQRPRLSPEMLARIKAGEKLEEVLRSSLAPFAPGALNESPAPCGQPSPVTPSTPVQPGPKPSKRKAAAARFDHS